MFFQEPFLEGVFRGSKCRPSLKSLILGPFPDFKGSRNRPRGAIFAQKASNSGVLFTSGTVLEPPGSQPVAQNGPGTDFYRFWTDFLDFRLIFDGV